MNNNPTRGGCGHCPYDETSCYELKRTGGICAYDGVFTEITYEDCEFRKFPTNADRIRQMTDEELAEWLIDWDNEGHDYCIDPCVSHDGYYDCKYCLVEWLKKEVDDG